MKGLLFFRICIYVYLYVCRQCYLLNVVLETCDSSDMSEKETFVFLALFILKNDFLTVRKPSTFYAVFLPFFQL